MPADRPNILVMLTDDHAQWALGCYGNRQVRTPTMDRLAATGVRFAQAFTETPVCSPGRACFWTGLYPSHHGVHDYIGQGEAAFNDRDWIAPYPHLGKMLHAAGYTCGFFGKGHTGCPEKPREGFDRWFAAWRRTGPHRGGALKFSDQGRPVEIAGYNDQIITDQALDWLATRGRDRPFFCYVAPVATHSPYADHPDRLVDVYRRMGRMVDIPDDITHPFGRQVGESGDSGRSDWFERQAQYYAAAEFIDAQLGRLVDQLEQMGELDDTVVVYTADHGLNCGQHGLWGKGNATRPYNMLEESIRIPMIVGGGRNHLFGRQVRGECVQHCDLFETLAELGGAAKPEGFHYPGRSFSAILRDAAGPGDWREIHVGEYGDLRMARSAEAKLIRRHGRGDDQLFDLLADPRETRNVISDPAYGQVIARLDQAIERHFAPMAGSPNNGLLVERLAQHNPVEAWRGQPW